MKRLTFVLIIAVIFSQVIAQDQEDSKFIKNRFSVSIFGSTLVLVSVGNISFDLYFKTGGKILLGSSVGFTGVMDCNAYSSSGGHITLTMLSRRSRGFIESKFGVAHVPIGYEYGSWIHSLKTYPVISVGYHFQKPDSPLFFRVALSTGGFGLGVGISII